MDEIFNLLQTIRERYGMYIGKKSLERLVAYVGGYINCMHKRGEDLTNLRMGFIPGFQEYIEELYNIHTDHNWSSIIQFFSNSDAEAFDLFYERLDDFLAEQDKK